MTTWSGVTPKDWTDTGVPTAAEFNAQLRDLLLAYTDEWSTYTPAWTAATTNPTLGTGAIQSGRYTRIGRLVIGQARLVTGASGFVGGSGNYRFSLPVAAAQATGALVGSCSVKDSTTASYNGVIRTLTSTTVEAIFHATTTFYANPTFPMTWAASDAFIYTFAYEASTG